MRAWQTGGMELNVFTEPQQGASYDDLLRVARAAEDLGYDAFFRSDHYLAMGVDGAPGPTDAWITLAGLARDTSRVRLGTLVSSATFRLPGPLAIAVAGVDQMSGGRVELGLGSGWFGEEHDAYGIEFPEVGVRFDRLEEQLAIITGLWETAPGETFDFAGTHYRLTDSPALPKPVQSPRPPVIVGGAGKRRTPALAARFADEYNAPFKPPDAWATLFARVRSACSDAGRDPDSLRLSAANVVCCGRDDAQVHRRAAAIGREADDVRSHEFGGTPAELVDRLGRLAEAGASRAYLQVLDLDDLDHLELVADQVLPQLA
jgi:F420-dependent oxidoreductase-like protein